MTRPGWIDEELFPFQSRFIEIDGCRVHYVDEGDGPPILFVHGNPTWSFLYRDIIGLLKERFRCIAIDHPGFGLSTARPGYGFMPAEHTDVLAHFIHELDLRELTVMGQDWGGPIGLGAAARQPERIAALVIANTWAWPMTHRPYFQVFSRTIGGPIGHWLIHRYNAFVELAMPMGTVRTKVTKRIVDHYRAPFATPSARKPTWIFPRQILHARDYLAEVERGLEKLADRPVLILWGTADSAFRGKERRRFERSFPDHRTVLLPGVGHYVQEDAPAEVADAISVWHPLGDTRQRALRLKPSRPRFNPGTHR